MDVLLETGCFYVVRVEDYLEDNWGDQVSSVQQSVKRALGGVNLKNLHC
jgi:hypothetical protein